MNTKETNNTELLMNFYNQNKKMTDKKVRKEYE